MAKTEVLMPLMGEGVHEATLVRWLKKPGEKIEKDEPLLEVSTDKVDTEIPSPASGVLVSTMFEEGATLTVNEVIAHIGDGGAEKAAPPKKSASGEAPTPPPRSAHAERSDGALAARKTGKMEAPTFDTTVRSSPLVRKMARENEVDLSQVAGTGMHGRITKRDIMGFLEEAPTTSLGSAATRSAPPATVGRPTVNVPDEAQHLKTNYIDHMEYLDGVPVRRVKMSRMRKAIAEHMVQSVKTSPHVTTVFEMDAHKIVELRDAYKDKFRAREGFNLTYTAFFLHAAVKAIKEHPIVNVSVDGDDILYKKDINIGCAVALEDGLIVPVIKNAGELSLLGIARRLNDLVLRARNKKLSPDEVRGGTFSVTNPGIFGSLVSSPIINQPQVAMLGLGAITKRPVVIDDMIGVRPLIQISLTFDHRAVDGEGGAKYLATLKEIIESYSEVPE